MSGKKPTMNQVKNVINNMLIELSSLKQMIIKLDSILLTYIEFKGDGLEWNKWLDKKIKEEESKENKDGSNEVPKESDKGIKKAKK